MTEKGKCKISQPHPNSDIMGNGFTCKCGANYNYFFNYCPDCGHQHMSMEKTLRYPLGLKPQKGKGTTIEENIKRAIGGEEQ